MDFGTGAIEAWGQTFCTDDFDYTISCNAGVRTTLSSSIGTGLGQDYEYNNCGEGCALSEVYSEVQFLDTTYYERSDHDADADGICEDEEDCSGDDSRPSEASYTVPPAPTIAINNIDASNPNSVTFTYDVIGPPLFSLQMQYGGLSRFTNDAGSGLVSFSSWDQNSYPMGLNTATVLGGVYGFIVPGQSCDINVETQSVPNSSGAYITVGGEGDPPMAPHAITVSHMVADVINPIVSYCTNAAGPKTRLFEATANIQLVNVDDVAIFLMNEVHNYLGFSDQLHATDDPITVPEQSKQFQSRDIYYSNPANNWIGSGVDAQICNTGLILTDTDFQSILWGGIYSPSCSGIQLP